MSESRSRVPSGIGERREAAGASLLGGWADGIARGLTLPMDAVVFSRDRLRQTLDEAAERGRVTREQANELFAELIYRGRDGASQLTTVAERSSAPIAGYDDLTARQVRDRVLDLTGRELRSVRDYERRHANRKSVLDAVEKALSS